MQKHNVLGNLCDVHVVVALGQLCIKWGTVALCELSHPAGPFPQRREGGTGLACLRDWCPTGGDAGCIPTGHTPGSYLL